MPHCQYAIPSSITIIITSFLHLLSGLNRLNPTLYQFIPLSLSRISAIQFAIKALYGALCRNRLSLTSSLRRSEAFVQKIGDITEPVLLSLRRYIYISTQMAFEQNFQEPTADFESDGDVSLKQKWKSISASPTVSENVNGCFECNICLDSVHDPVVTLCGHLYCWPCIYKWLHVQSSSRFSPESEEQPKCPVCKANISHSSLVPLYGRGTSPSESDAKKAQLDLVIPRRPPALGVHALMTSMTSHPNQQLHPTPFQSQPQPFPHPYGNYASMTQSNLGGTTMNSFFSPTVGMFGEMVFARFFGSSDTSLFAYPYSNSFPVTGNGSPRMRRQEMQVDKSLNRVSIFLFCCFVLCLLLF